MNVLDLCTKNKLARTRLIEFVGEVVMDGAKNFTDLCISDKREIVAYLIDALDEKYEWLVESNKFDLTMKKLINVMVCYDSDNKDDFLEAIQDQAVDYFSQELNDFINELSNEHHWIRNEDYYNENPHLLNPEYVNGTDYVR